MLAWGCIFVCYHFCLLVLLVLYLYPLSLSHLPSDKVKSREFPPWRIQSERSQYGYRSPSLAPKPIALGRTDYSVRVVRCTDSDQPVMDPTVARNSTNPIRLVTRPERFLSGWMLMNNTDISSGPSTRHWIRFPPKKGAWLGIASSKNTVPTYPYKSR